MLKPHHKVFYFSKLERKLRLGSAAIEYSHSNEFGFMSQNSGFKITVWMIVLLK